jgi:hypothetical protein
MLFGNSGLRLRRIRLGSHRVRPIEEHALSEGEKAAFELAIGLVAVFVLTLTALQWWVWTGA